MVGLLTIEMNVSLPSNLLQLRGKPFYVNFLIPVYYFLLNKFNNNNCLKFFYMLTFHPGANHFLTCSLFDINMNYLKFVEKNSL